MRNVDFDYLIICGLFNGGNVYVPGESEKTWGVWWTVTPHSAIRLS